MRAPVEWALGLVTFSWGLVLGWFLADTLRVAP